MAKRLTLAEQLAQINEPAPQDYDPEDSYATYNHERRRGGGGEDDEGAEGGAGKDDSAAAARADYVDVGQSKLRKRGEAVLDSKYEGKKGSRADLYAFSDNDDDEGSDEEDDNEGMDEELADLLNGGEEGSDDEEGEGYESEGGDFEDLEGGEGASSFGPGGAGDFASDDDDDEAEEEEEEEEAPVPAKKEKEPTKVRVSKDDRAMVKQLKQAASADVEKGRDVKKQLAFADSLLSSRIALQKAVQASNALPTPASHPPAPVWFDDEETKDEVDELWKELVGCSEELFALRKDLLTTNESLSFPSDFGSSRKRKRSAAEAEGAEAVERKEWLEETMRDLAEVEKILDPFLRTTVTKWSDKVLAASGLSLSKGSSSNKFKAVNQNAMQQVDHALSAQTGERERLIKRTRVRRTTEGVGAVVLGAGAAKREKGREEEGDVLAPLEGEEREKQSKEVDVECFDDSDWYGQVLRDLVESRMLDLDDSTLTQLRQASALARGKKVKKVVDTRASKGRKIRYHVHEKAQNFMIPVEAGHWHDEQIDELFASLLGRSFPQAAAANGAGGKEEVLDPALDDVAGQKAGEIEVGSLRLFG